MSQNGSLEKNRLKMKNYPSQKLSSEKFPREESSTNPSRTRFLEIWKTLNIINFGLQCEELLQTTI
jgi:hypothetical protein